MERRFLDQRMAGVDVAEVEGRTVIRGLGAVFYDEAQADLTSFRFMIADKRSGKSVRVEERMMPGILAPSTKTDDCVCLFDHDTRSVLGALANDTLKLIVESRGVAYEAYPPETRDAQDVVLLLKGKYVKGSSFEFRADDQHWSRKGDLIIREVRSLKSISDIGPVTRPAYKGTTADAELRSLTDMPEFTDLLTRNEQRQLRQREFRRLQVNGLKRNASV